MPISWDYSDWMGDKLSSDQFCLSEAEAEQEEHERVYRSCAAALIRLGLTPRSFVNQRLWRDE